MLVQIALALKIRNSLPRANIQKPSCLGEKFITSLFRLSFLLYKMGMIIMPSPYPTFVTRIQSM